MPAEVFRVLLKKYTLKSQFSSKTFKIFCFPVKCEFLSNSVKVLRVKLFKKVYIQRKQFFRF